MRVSPLILISSFFTFCFAQSEDSTVNLPTPMQITIGDEGTNGNSDVLNGKIDKCMAVTRHGATVYFVGLGLEYAVAVPLQIVSLVNENLGLFLTSKGIGMASTGLEIAGAIRANVGASMAYDYAQNAGLKPDKNSNWHFYRIGLILAGVSAILSTTSTSDPSTAGTVSSIALGCSIASTAMWITSVANSIHYIKNVTNNKDAMSRLNITPYVTLDKKTGLVVSYDF